MKNTVVYILIVLVAVGGVFFLTMKPEVKVTDENNKKVSDTQTTTVEEKTEVRPTVQTQTTVNPKPAPTPTQTPTTSATASTGTSQNTPAETPAPKTHEINIISFAFNPKTLTINKGDTVVWTNNDSAPHDVVGINYTKLRSVVMSKGQKVSFTFNDVGTFDYICSIHPMMKASITVK